MLLFGASIFNKMLKTKKIRSTLILLIAGLFLLGCTPGGDYVQFGGYAQGGTWSVKANLKGIGRVKGSDGKCRRVKPKEIQSHIEAILEEIDTTLSGYNKASQLSRLNAGDTIRPSAMLMELYDYAYSLWLETDGALDCAAGPLYDIWGFGFKNGELPDDGAVQHALRFSGMKRLKPKMEDAMRDGLLWGPWLETQSPDDGGTDHAVAHADILVLPQLNFNAVAQGYSCDMVAAYLDSLGVYDMLVDIGEIWCRGQNPSGKAWRVGVDRPVDGNNRPGADMDGIWESGSGRNGGAEGPAQEHLDGGNGRTPLAGGQGIVTSGNYRKYYVRNGQKYSHTIDPRTGYPVGTGPAVKAPDGEQACGNGRHRADDGGGILLSATIVAPTAAAADAYATYCMVIGFEAARDFIESRPDLEGYLIYAPPVCKNADFSHGDGENGQSVCKKAGFSHGDGAVQAETAPGMAEWASKNFRLAN